MRALMVALAVLVCAPAARAQDIEGRELARQKFKTGEAKFRAGDYRGALLEFLAADAIAPSAILVHNVAVCHERLGESDEAARRYREYLSRRPDAPNRAEVQARIAALERSARPADVLPVDDDGLREPRSEQPPPPSEPRERAYDETFARRVPSLSGAERAPVAAAPPREPQPTPEPAPAPAPAMPEPKKEKPLYKQWWFWVFVGVGAVILVDIATSGNDDRPETSSGLTLIRF
jgi:hypothetical protein